MSQRRECPDQPTLLQFLTNSLDPAETANVKAHVESCEQCRALLDSLVADAQTLVSDDEHDSKFDADFLSASTNPDAIGRLGNYDITHVIGSGGMGVVFAAHDPKLDRTVAIKVLSRHLVSSSKARARFSREARAAAGVKHPNVVTIHSVEEHHGFPFLVMEYIDGITLHEKIVGVDELSPIEILRISSQIASGLAAAHERGVVHRDIKPANVMLEGRLEEVKITDFGLARIMVDNTEISLANETVGTPSFMSPEQASGGRIDARSDLFSLGVVMYAMAEGYSPFRGGTLIEVIRKISDVEPQALHELGGKFPRFLSRVVSRLLDKDPDKRYQSAEQLMKVLAYQHSQFNLANTNEVQMLLDSGEALEPDHDKPQPRRLVPVLLSIGVLAALGAFWYFAGRPSGANPQITPVGSMETGHDAASSEANGRLADELAHEREVAEWVVNRGAVSITTVAGDSSKITRVEDLPTDGFHISEIDLSNCFNVGDSDLKNLKGLKRVVRIQLHSTDVAGPGLAHLSGLTTLAYLGLKGCPISDDGLEPISTIVNLEQLSLMDTALGDAGCAHLKPLTNLRRLYFNNTLLTDDAIPHFEDLSRLEIAELAGTEITDTGLEQLAAHTTLQRLYLRDTRVTDAGIRRLESLDKLSLLDVTGTAVTFNGVRQFKQALPQCEVIK